jgi:hypothetical protein
MWRLVGSHLCPLSSAQGVRSVVEPTPRQAGHPCWYGTRMALGTPTTWAPPGANARGELAGLPGTLRFGVLFPLRQTTLAPHRRPNTGRNAGGGLVAAQLPGRSATVGGLSPCPALSPPVAALPAGATLGAVDTQPSAAGLRPHGTSVFKPSLQLGTHVLQLVQ